MAILITGRLGSRDKKKHFIVTLKVESSRHYNPKHVHVSQESIKVHGAKTDRRENRQLKMIF